MLLPCPSDVSDEDWSLVVPYLTPMTEAAPQQDQRPALRDPLRHCDSRTLRSTPESGNRAGYDSAKRKRGSKVHMAVDTLGHMLASHVTPADIGDSVSLAYVEQGYTGEAAAKGAARGGLRHILMWLINISLRKVEPFPGGVSISAACRNKRNRSSQSPSHGGGDRFDPCRTHHPTRDGPKARDLAPGGISPPRVAAPSASFAEM